MGSSSSGQTEPLRPDTNRPIWSQDKDTRRSSTQIRRPSDTEAYPGGHDLSQIAQLAALPDMHSAGEFTFQLTGLANDRALDLFHRLLRTRWAVLLVACWISYTGIAALFAALYCLEYASAAHQMTLCPPVSCLCL